MASPDKTPQRPSPVSPAAIWESYAGELEALVVRLQQELKDRETTLAQLLAPLHVALYHVDLIPGYDRLNHRENVTKLVRDHLHEIERKIRAALVSSPDKTPEPRKKLPTPDEVLGILPRPVGGEPE